jgi:hypothetical protein
MAEPAPRAPLRPWRAFAARFALAHFIAYPVTVVAAVGATPLGLWINEGRILSAGPTGARWRMLEDALNRYNVSATEAAQVQIVVQFVVLFCGAVFALIHAASIPWAVSAARAAKLSGAPDQPASSGFRLFVASTAATLVVVALIGVSGWTWLFIQ